MGCRPYCLEGRGRRQQQWGEHGQLGAAPALSSNALLLSYWGDGPATRTPACLPKAFDVNGGGAHGPAPQVLRAWERRKSTSKLASGRSLPRRWVPKAALLYARGTPTAAVSLRHGALLQQRLLTATLAMLDLMDCTVTKAARFAVYVEVTSSACGVGWRRRRQGGRGWPCEPKRCKGSRLRPPLLPGAGAVCQRRLQGSVLSWLADPQGKRPPS